MNKFLILLRFRQGSTSVTYPAGGAYSTEAAYQWCEQWRKERGNKSQQFEVTQIHGKIKGVNLRDDRRV